MNDDDEKFERRYQALEAAQRGTDLHKFACDAIRLRIKQKTRPPTTIGMYVNDAIGYRMVPEQVLFYSINFFGTADAIGFSKNKLRIFDLKNGVSPTSEHQLEVYAALFCLEYGVKPFDIVMDLRIYQNIEARIYEGDPDKIAHIMDKIVTFDKKIRQWGMEA